MTKEEILHKLIKIQISLSIDDKDKNNCGWGCHYHAEGIRGECIIFGDLKLREGRVGDKRAKLCKEIFD